MFHVEHYPQDFIFQKIVHKKRNESIRYSSIFFSFPILFPGKYYFFPKLLALLKIFINNYKPIFMYFLGNNTFLCFLCFTWNIIHNYSSDSELFPKSSSAASTNFSKLLSSETTFSKLFPKSSLC